MIHAFFSDMRRQPVWFSGFLILLFLFPLPFGANRPWASDLAAVLCGAFILLMLWERRQAAKPTGTPPTKRLVAAAAGFSIVFLWSFIQVSSWVPQGWQHPLWNEAASLLQNVEGSISIDRGAFAESLLRFSTAIACFLLAFVGCRDSARAKLLIQTVIAAGFVYALYGLLAHAVGSEHILWFKKWAYQGFLTSTFVNKNSYAAYAGLGLIASMPWLWQMIANKKTDALLAKRSRAAALYAALTLKDYLAFLVPILILAALALTGSRGGVLSSLTGVFIFLSATALHNRKQPRSWLWLTSLGLVIFIAFVALGGNALQERMGQSKLSDDTTTRLAAYKLETQAIGDNPWFGFGLGSFDSAFKLYRDQTLQNWFHHAHNDYLEMMMDLGVPVALILFLSIALLISCCVDALWKRRRDGHFAALALGASALVATHAFVDFSLHIPAIAATYAALLGTGVAQSWSTRSKEE